MGVSPSAHLRRCTLSRLTYAGEAPVMLAAAAENEGLDLAWTRCESPTYASLLAHVRWQVPIVLTLGGLDSLHVRTAPRS